MHKHHFIYGLVYILGLILFLPQARGFSVGELDETFGAEGYLDIIKPVGVDQYTTAVVDDEGRMIIATFTNIDPTAEDSVSIPALVRYLSDGTIDTTFGNAGTLLLNEIVDVKISKIVFDENDKIYLLCKSDDYEPIYIVRVTAGGIRDNSWNSTGVLEINPSAGLDLVTGFALDPLGRPILTGYRSVVGDYFVLRFLDNGSLDTSFSGDGKAVIGFGAGSIARAMAIDGNGRIAVAGDSTLVSGGAAAVFNVSGELDSTFSSDGKWSPGCVFESDDQPPICIGDPYFAAFDGENRLLLMGFEDSKVLMRLNTSGELDVSFANGFGYTKFPVPLNEGQAIFVDERGFVLVATNTPILEEGLVVSRFTNTGTFDASFSQDGMANFNPSSEAFAVADFFQDTSGRYLLAGISETRLSIARYFSDGSDILLMATPQNAILAAGENIAITLTILNQGLQIAKSPRVTLSSSNEDTAIANAVVSAGTCSAVGAAIVCEFDQLAVGESVMLTADVGVQTSATLTAIFSGSPDPTPDNAVTTVTLTVPIDAIAEIPETDAGSNDSTTDDSESIADDEVPVAGNSAVSGGCSLVARTYSAAPWGSVFVVLLFSVMIIARFLRSFF